VSPFETLLRQHIKDARDHIKLATSRVDALEAQVNRLAESLANGGAIAAPLDRVPKLYGWSPQEEELLREQYPLVGAPGCAKLLPHRTEMAIRVHATRALKLSRQSGPGVAKANIGRVWCGQCEHRVSPFQVENCQSRFCKAKVEAA
jgi:hypothetical protein